MAPGCLKQNKYLFHNLSIGNSQASVSSPQKITILLQDEIAQPPDLASPPTTRACMTSQNHLQHSGFSCTGLPGKVSRGKIMSVAIKQVHSVLIPQSSLWFNENRAKAQGLSTKFWARVQWYETWLCGPMETNHSHNNQTIYQQSCC